MGINDNFITLAERIVNNKNIKFIAQQSYGFPVNDVASFSEERDQIRLSFMGLRGVDSPLPYYITQNNNLDFFINCIDHKLYLLFYRGLIKYFCNFYNKDFNYISQIIKSSFSYSRENLYKNIQNYLGEHIKFEIKDFVLNWQNRDQKYIKLGEYSLGSKVVSQHNKIIINIGPILLSQAREIRQDLKFNQMIRENINLFNKFQIKFKVLTSCVNHVVIGQWILH